MTKWEPPLSEGELARIARLSTEQLLEMLRAGDRRYAYSALQMLKVNHGWRRNFDALMDLAAKRRGRMIVEGFFPERTGPKPRAERVLVDKFLDFLEAQLSKRTPSIPKKQAIRSMGQVVRWDTPVWLATPRSAGRATTSEDDGRSEASKPPYGSARVRRILMSCLNHPEWDVRRTAIGWLGYVGANERGSVQEIIAALETQREKEAASDESAKAKDWLRREIDAAISTLKQTMMMRAHRNHVPPTRSQSNRAESRRPAVTEYKPTPSVRQQTALKTEQTDRRGPPGAAAQATTELRWDERRIRDYPIYRLLLKARAYGSGVSEPSQWSSAKEKGKPFVDPRREKNLREVLSRHPESEYADDAALLLARARFFYHDDAKGAIEDLYKVISRYPKGTWFAENRLFLEYAVVSNVMRGGRPRRGWHNWLPSLEKIKKMGKAGEDEMRRWRRVQEELCYWKYWKEHPNLTRDEARYWIAWIIIKGDLRDRFPEAEQNLRQLVELRRPKDARRTPRDQEAARRREHGTGITRWMFRTERKAHLFLIEWLVYQKKFDFAKAAASDYAKLHAGHSTVARYSKQGLLK